MFINFSNHPSDKWPANQLQAAHQYGEIVDLPFPNINPEADEKYITDLANKYAVKIEKLSAHHKVIVHVMGEMNFLYSFVKRMRAQGIVCVASTTKRIVRELSGDRKESFFQFVQFRMYE